MTGAGLLALRWRAAPARTPAGMHIGYRGHAHLPLPRRGGQARACGGGHEHAPDSGVLRRENRLFAGRQGRRCGRFASPPLPLPCTRALATRTDAAMGGGTAWLCRCVQTGAHLLQAAALQARPAGPRVRAWCTSLPHAVPAAIEANIFPLSMRDGGK
jgi:hypothetical protein